MTNPSRLGEREPPSQPPSHQGSRAGALDGKPAEQAKNQTSKAWFILAITVGILVVGGAGAFGGVGLLQSHGLISLPHWLSSAIGTVGNTPHFWSLWAIAAGGVLAGGGLIAVSSSKIHTIRKEANRAATEERPVDEAATREVAETNKVLDRAFLENNFSKINRSPDPFIDVQDNHYKPFVDGTNPTGQCFVESKKEDRFFIVRRNNGKLECTRLYNWKTNDILNDQLNLVGYTLQENTT